MQWIRDIALFLVFSGILLEMIADTKYYKFAKWVAGLILLLQFHPDLKASSIQLLTPKYQKSIGR